MYIQDLLSWNQFDDEHLIFFRTLGIDYLCLDIRSMHRMDGELDLRENGDNTNFFEVAKATVESHGMLLHSVFMAGWDEITLAMPDRDETIEAWCQMIRNIGAEPEIGEIYQGKVVKTLDFGAFVNFIGSRDGLVHISELENRRVGQVTDGVQEGEEVYVKVLAIDDRGKVRLSMKVVNQETGQELAQDEPAEAS